MPAASTAPDALLVVGRGRAGSALHRALAARSRQRAFRAAITSGRAPEAERVSRAAVVVIAVPDPAIASVAAEVARHLRPRAIVLHVAGSRGAEVLAPCRAAGAAVGVMHPLVALPRGATLPARAPLVCAGDPRALAAIRAIARQIGARAIVRAVHGPAYHAAAALVANGACALAARGIDVLVGLGLREPDARHALAALLASVAESLHIAPASRALTGPIARGDAETIARHRAALDPRARAAYDAIAPVILGVATDAGLPEESARAIRAAVAEELSGTPGSPGSRSRGSRSRRPRG